MDYIADIRQYIGTRPLIMCGANVLIINKDNELLLHHRRDRDVWGLPGGAMELGETLEETAQREMFEEVNLSVENLKLFQVYSGPDLYYKYPDGNEVYNVTTTYLCKHYSGDIVVEQTEGRDARFFKLDDIPSNLSSPIIMIIEDYLNTVGKTLKKGAL